MPSNERVLSEVRIANFACMVLSLVAVVYCQLWESQAGPEAQQVRGSVTGPSKARSPSAYQVAGS